MSTKLYPPGLQGTLPAFIQMSGGSYAAFTVPFTMNVTVSKTEVSAMNIKLKTAFSDTLIETLTTTDIDWETCTIKGLSSTKNKYNVGQYYKVQIAYVSMDGTVGYYSDVGIIKCTSMPTIEIEDLSEADNNHHRYNYVGTYTNKDSSEKVVSYRFIVKDVYGETIADSGQLTHNSANDADSTSSYDTFEFNRELEDNVEYTISYIVTTNNNLMRSSPAYKILEAGFATPLTGAIDTTLDMEEGSIKISFAATDLEQPLVAGTYILARASEADNYQIWNQLCTFVLEDSYLSKHFYTDFSTEQGITYKYSLQKQVSTGLYTERLESEPIQTDFEYCYLYDGERQLKIKYNPKVNSFKNTLLESKVNTIGGKYPFIFRNGNVSYKEFPIAGLVSYHMDENFLFLKPEEYLSFDIDARDSVDLTATNILWERQFKLKVLDWLNNGQPKLFKSPVEGNYIVRLMNVSMTPTDTVGRMLHSFACTAYEIQDYTFKNLETLGFVGLEADLSRPMSRKTISLVGATGKINTETAYLVQIEDMLPGSKILLNGNEYIIPSTGKYITDVNVPIRSIEVPTGVSYTSGQITYSYYADDVPLISTFAVGATAEESDIAISKIVIQNLISRQFIGSDENVKDKDIVQDLILNNKIKDIITYNLTFRKNFNNLAGNMVYSINGSDATLYQEDYTIYGPLTLEDLTSLKIGDGLIVEITAKVKEYTYDFEQPYIKDLYISLFYYRLFDDKEKYLQAAREKYDAWMAAVDTQFAQIGGEA